MKTFCRDHFPKPYLKVVHRPMSSQTPFVTTSAVCVTETRNVGFLTAQLLHAITLSLPETNINFAFFEINSPFAHSFKRLSIKYRIDTILSTLGSDETAVGNWSGTETSEGKVASWRRHFALLNVILESSNISLKFPYRRHYLLRTKYVRPKTMDIRTAARIDPSVITVGTLIGVGEARWPIWLS